MSAALRSELVELAAESIGEPVVDLLLTDGLVREIPVLSTLIGAINTGKGVRDFMFLRKVVRLLNAAERNSTQRDRAEFCTRLRDDGELRERLGMTLVAHIDKADSLRKSELLGLVSAATMRGELTTTELEELFHAIDKCTPHDALAAVRCRFDLSPLPLPCCVRLMAGGLIFQASGVVTLRDGTNTTPSFESTALLNALARALEVPS